MHSRCLKVPVVDEVEEQVGQVRPDTNDKVHMVESDLERNSHNFPFFWWQMFESEEHKVVDSFDNVGLLMGRDFKEVLY